MRGESGEGEEGREIRTWRGVKERRGEKGGGNEEKEREKGNEGKEREGRGEGRKEERKVRRNSHCQSRLLLFG